MSIKKSVINIQFLIQEQYCFFVINCFYNGYKILSNVYIDFNNIQKKTDFDLNINMKKSPITNH